MSLRSWKQFLPSPLVLFALAMVIGGAAGFLLIAPKHQEYYIVFGPLALGGVAVLLAARDSHRFDRKYGKR